MEMVGTQCHPVVPTLCLEVSGDAAMAAWGERGRFKMSREWAPLQGGLLVSAFLPARPVPARLDWVTAAV